jgi:hypothetical protein
MREMKRQQQERILAGWPTGTYVMLAAGQHQLAQLQTINNPKTQYLPINANGLLAAGLLPGAIAPCSMCKKCKCKCKCKRKRICAQNAVWKHDQTQQVGVVPPLFQALCFN